jgi:TDG/mug DNA glycosylase family protein
MTSKPGRRDLEAARDKTIADVVEENLDVIFCGINPSLYSAAIGRHFARPGNRFWPALYGAGFTPTQFTADAQERLLALGCGITNVVARATASAAELGVDELRAGARDLRRRVLRLEPRFLAILGIGAYRMGFDQRSATLGPQRERIGDTRLWVLPNPSGLNAHYQLPDLVRLFAELRSAVASDAVTMRAVR